MSSPCPLNSSLNIPEASVRHPVRASTISSVRSYWSIGTKNVADNWSRMSRSSTWQSIICWALNNILMINAPSRKARSTRRLSLSGNFSTITSIMCLMIDLGRRYSPLIPVRHVYTKCKNNCTRNTFALSAKLIMYLTLRMLNYF